MKRREFITLLGGAVTAWPLPLRAQKHEVRRIAVLMGIAQTVHSDAYVDAFFQRLDELGWTKGRNINTDVQWWKREPEQNRTTVAKMLALSPDVILAFSNAALAMLKPTTKQVPIVFLKVGDPVGSGFVASLAHPGGNITGFAGYDGTMGGKWLEVLKETAPQVTSVLTIFQPETPVHQGLWHSIEDSAQRLGLEASPGAVHNPVEIERVISSFAIRQNGGIIVLPHADISDDLVAALGLRYRLPTLFSDAGPVTTGGLVSYTYDLRDTFQRVAEYVDRIFRGEKPSDLPVQQPTKFSLVINLKTAKTLGITVPASLLARADELIEN
jgi:putative tryptophan/tyrosine transport system substrate-binding protein